MPQQRIYNVHTHIFNFKCVPSGFLTNYLPRAAVAILSPLLRWYPSAWVLSKVMGVLPIEMVKKYHSFVAIGIMNTPQLVFEGMASSYTGQNAAFVVLPMDFTYMGGGDSPANYATQLQLVADVKRAYPNTCYPFIGVDPRMGNAQQILSFVKGFFEPDFKGFQGIKLYPSLGFYPADYRLDLMYEYCEANEIPITTHCTRGGAFYAGQTVPPQLFNYQSFNETPVIRARRTQTFYQQLNSLPPKNSCNAFLDPVNYYDVLQKYPKLKLNLAHFGGDEEIIKSLTDQTSNTGDLSTGYANNTSWYYIVKDLMSQFPNVYTDVSYTLYDTLPADGVAATIAADMQGPLGDKILFGTDFFMTLQEKEELALYTDFQNALANPILWQKLACINTQNFLSNKFYTVSSV